jgi:hypothetical protein
MTAAVTQASQHQSQLFIRRSSEKGEPMFSFQKIAKLTACSLAVLGAATSSAWAHHGGGTFDATKCYNFNGTIRQMAWVNPHSWIYIDVTKTDGTKELWGFELSTVSGLSREGFRPEDFVKGSKVTVSGNANRDAKVHTASTRSLKLADGRMVAGGAAGTVATGGGAGGPPGGGAGGPPGGAGGFPGGGAGGPPGGAGGFPGGGAGGPPGGGAGGPGGAQRVTVQCTNY